MKGLFVSDIHLNLRKDKDWEKDRFKKLISFIREHNSEVVILGGDIFDLPTPNVDEIGLFYEEILKIKNKQIIVISGNHCETSKNESVFDKLPQVNFVYYDTMFKPLKIGKINCYFVSHHQLKTLSKIQLKTGINVLFSHIRCDLGVVKEEYNLRRLSKYWDYVVLGDIHIPYKPYNNIEYCGSPYTIQYEPKRETGVLEIDFSDFKTKFISTSFLPQRIKLEVEFAEFKELEKTLDDYHQYKIIVNVLNQKPITNKQNIKVISQVIKNNEKDEEIKQELLYKANIDIIDKLMLYTEKECDKDSFTVAKPYYDKIKQVVNIKKGL